MNSGSIFEDRKTALALFLCFMLVMIYSEYVLTPALKPVPTTEQATQESTQETSKVAQAPALPQRSDIQNTTAPDNATANSETASTQSNIAATTQTEVPTEETIRAAGIIRIESPLYRIELSKLGGRILNFELKGYKRELESKEYFNFIRHQEGAEFPLGITLGGAKDTELLYTLDGVTQGITRQGDTFTINEKDELRFKLVGTTSPLEKSFIFKGDSYLFDAKATSSVPAPDGSPLSLAWIKWISEEETASRYNPVNFMIFTAQEDLEKVLVTEPEDGPQQDIKSRWISVGDKYFMAALLNPEGSQPVRWAKDGDLYTIATLGNPTEVSTKIYLGPKSYLTLDKLGNELQRNVDLGFFSFLALPLLSCVYFFYGLLGNYGLAIILLTLCIKTLFLPLTQASFKSMKAMQELQPEMKALRERVSDPTQLNQEMMALYKKRGVNPMGGCLPMLVQIPVFFGLYSALLNATELRHASFALWITDLSAPEALTVAGIGIPVMLLLMGASMFFQQLLTPSAMDPQQRKIMLFMPVVMTVMFIIIPFPSGLVLYWLVNNLISIIQQAYIRKENSIGPGKATILASIGIFAFGWFLTII